MIEEFLIWDYWDWWDFFGVLIAPRSRRNAMAVINDPQTYEIIGAAIHVHTVLGHGFFEKVYQEALAIEFSKRNIPFEKEVAIPIVYEGRVLDTHYRADFVCYGSIIVELKALQTLGKNEIAQVLNYLKATRYRVGLLINFGSPSLEKHRIRNKFLKGELPSIRSASETSVNRR